MKKDFKILFGIVTLLLFVIVGYLIMYEYPKFQKKARESEVKLALQAFKTAEDSYFDEWKKYSSSRVDIGFNAEGSRLRHKIYLRVEELSPSELELLGENLPIVQDSFYKVIARSEGETYATYWSFDNTGKLEKIIDVPK